MSYNTACMLLASYSRASRISNSAAAARRRHKQKAHRLSRRAAATVTTASVAVDPGRTRHSLASLQPLPILSSSLACYRSIAAVGILTLLTPTVANCHMGAAIKLKHRVRDRVKTSFVILTSGHSDAQPRASECPDVK